MRCGVHWVAGVQLSDTAKEAASQKEAAATAQKERDSAVADLEAAQKTAQLLNEEMTSLKAKLRTNEVRLLSLAQQPAAYTFAMCAHSLALFLVISWCLSHSLQNFRLPFECPGRLSKCIVFSRTRQSHS